MNETSKYLWPFLDLDSLYDAIDEGLKNGRFREIDRWLLWADTDEASIDFLLGLLVATLPVKSKLTQRGTIFSITKYKLKKEGKTKEQIDELLKGLE